MIISVESNIGAGGKHFLRYLSQRGWNVRYQPTEWRNVAGTNILDLFRSNPRKYAFMFQAYAMETQMVEPVDSVLITERSMGSCHEIFSRQLYNSGALNQVEYDVLSAIYERKQKNVDGVFYLRSSPNTCLNRIERRNRVGDVYLNLDYLKDLHEIHEDLFWQKHSVRGPISQVPCFRMRWGAGVIHCPAAFREAEWKLRIFSGTLKGEESSETES